MSDTFQPNSERAQKKFPQMRLTRAMAMDRIDHTFKSNSKAAIKSLNALFKKGSQSGGFNSAETKAANKWYKSKLSGKVVVKGAKLTGRGGGGSMKMPQEYTSRSLLKKPTS